MNCSCLKPNIQTGLHHTKNELVKFCFKCGLRPRTTSHNFSNVKRES